jgi:guanine deaminase
MTRKQALFGDLLDFTADPGLEDASGPGARFRPDYWLLVEDGRIAAVQAEAPGEDWQRVDHRGRLLLPGFIDTHVHSGQIDVIGAYGTALLDWLETHTFPAERRMEDRDHAQHIAGLFLDALLATGSTTASVFPTVHAHSADTLFAAAEARGMRLIAGKVLMDRNAPEFLRDDVEQAERECRELIERWHGRGRASYAVTPRFAPTSSDAQLAMAGRLLQSQPGLYMQTHVAENPDEVRWVAELFPAARSYLDVYAQHGLLNERAIFAHGIWLDDADRAALHQAGAQIAHCPSSNLFLGSGLFDWAAARDAGVNVSLGCDVGGGTSLSMLRTLGDAYKVQALRGRRLTAWQGLYAATLGAARALRLDGEIGHFTVGTLADLAVWDWALGAVAERRHAVARDLHDRLFAWMTLGDERNLVATYVAGQARYLREATPRP